MDSKLWDEDELTMILIGIFKNFLLSGDWCVLNLGSVLYLLGSIWYLLGEGWPG